MSWPIAQAAFVTATQDLLPKTVPAVERLEVDETASSGYKFWAYEALKASRCTAPLADNRRREHGRPPTAVLSDIAATRMSPQVLASA